MVGSSMRAAKPLAIVLGLNEVASAIAVGLHHAGYAVLMAHDPAFPVIRRGMSFFDALFDGNGSLGGVTAVSVDNVLAARAQVRTLDQITVTRLELSELLIIGGIDVLVDARMHSDAVTPQLRKLARFTIGVGKGFVSGEDCDAVVGARVTVEVAQRERRHAQQMLLMRSPEAGRWHTPLDVGTRIYKGFALGYLGSNIVKAPVDGVLRGIARDDTSVPVGAELVEITTGQGTRRWWGLDARGVRICEEVLGALSVLGALRPASSPSKLRLVHSR